MTVRSATSISEVVSSGFCIGCGLCEAVTRGRVRMSLTAQGSLRPSPLTGFARDEENTLLACCPGVAVEARSERGLRGDDVWGSFSVMRYAWAGDPGFRHRGSTAGVLSALAAFVLERGQAKSVLHVGADPAHPLRNRWFLSEDPDSVIARAGSRYAPTAPLAGLGAALERDEPFALIAKPCDLSAVHRYAMTDPRVDRQCIARLTFVCGGQSRLTKSLGVLEECGIGEAEVTSFRYRGHGNPGLTRVETRDGRVFEKTYNEQWEDESSWDLETRCKLCPDALGEAADIAVADVWPDGVPAGEDEGFSGIVVRSRDGQSLLDAAVAAGKVVLGKTITPREFDGFQPHQVAKKVALAARYRALADAGLPQIHAPGLRLDTLAGRLDEAAAEEEYSGMIRRIRDGRVTETAE